MITERIGLHPVLLPLLILKKVTQKLKNNQK